MKCEKCRKRKAIERVNGYELCYFCFNKWLNRNEDFDDINEDNTNLFNRIINVKKNLW
jgi:hypothetical protein